MWVPWAAWVSLTVRCCSAPEPAIQENMVEAQCLLWVYRGGHALSFLQYPLGPTGQPYSVWQGIQGHKHQGARSVGSHLRSWLSWVLPQALYFTTWWMNLVSGCMCSTGPAAAPFAAWDPCSCLLVYHFYLRKLHCCLSCCQVRANELKMWACGIGNFSVGAETKSRDSSSARFEAPMLWMLMQTPCFV